MWLPLTFSEWNNEILNPVIRDHRNEAIWTTDEQLYNYTLLYKYINIYSLMWYYYYYIYHDYIISLLWLYLLYTFVWHVYTCEYTCAGRLAQGVCVGGGRGQGLSSFMLLLRQGLSLNMKLTGWITNASQWAPHNILFLLALQQVVTNT